MGNSWRVIAFATCCQVLVLSVFNGFEGLGKIFVRLFLHRYQDHTGYWKNILLSAPAQLAQIKQQPFVH